MGLLAGKNILLGVTGGIAAYKAAELLRLLRMQQAGIRVVLTRSATEFVGPLTFQALSGHPVRSGLLDPDEESAMGHIALARWADLILVAPATADFIAKMRIGRADDLLSAVCLATEAPLAVAPAMNRVMWEHPATQENIAQLCGRGVSVFGPEQGTQACGEEGYGRMMEPVSICEQVRKQFVGDRLRGVKVLVSAGPTREPIDPVRFISNRSSGKMGYAVACAANDQGARVTLVSGPVSLEPPPVERVIGVSSAAEMFEAVVANAPDHDIYIGAAAVADYEPVSVLERKLKKDDQNLVLELRKTPDILHRVASLQSPPFTCGFAAETDHLETYARKKLQIKGLDMIAANLVGDTDTGFDSDFNSLQVFWPGGQKMLGKAQKTVLAEQLVRILTERYFAVEADKTR